MSQPTRTTPLLVKGILLGNYDLKNAPDLQPFIDAASAIVDRVQACALAKGTPLSDVELELIERWLSAHDYQMNDPGYVSRNTMSAGGSFDGGTGDGLEGTRYGRTAIRLDYSNCLRNVDKAQVARASWLGKPPSAQIPYNQRN